MNVWVIDHAARRFEERVRPGMGHVEASRELARLVREFGQECDWPVWVPVDAGVREPPNFCVALCDGVVVVCEPSRGARLLPRALTVITRAGYPRERLARRSKGLKRVDRLGRDARSGRRAALAPGFEDA